mmetsp:Transcript_1896/g.2727  ORF Transcript_1896/g.2727 Transcript_1896/m.2727 type:complete len:214 (-) Transcript_1896:564-1205(-)
MYVAASVLAAAISSSSAPALLSLRAFNVLKTHLSANFHTSALRLMAEEFPRFSQPISNNSPSGISSSFSSSSSAFISMDMDLGAETTLEFPPPVRTRPSVDPTIRLSLSLVLSRSTSSRHNSSAASPFSSSIHSSSTICSTTAFASLSISATNSLASFSILSISSVLIFSNGEEDGCSTTSVSSLVFSISTDESSSRTGASFSSLSSSSSMTV